MPASFGLILFYFCFLHIKNNKKNKIKNKIFKDNIIKNNNNNNKIINKINNNNDNKNKYKIINVLLDLEVSDYPISSFTVLYPLRVILASLKSCFEVSCTPTLLHIS